MNKRGWIHILEATIAVMVVAGVMVAFYSGQSVSGELSIADYSYSLQNEILDTLTMDSDLRLEILRVVNDSVGSTDQHYITLDNAVSAEVPDSFGHYLRVCNLSALDDVCNMPAPIFTATLDKDVFIEEEIVSSELGNGSDSDVIYSPKKVKLFLWEGDVAEEDCYNECGVEGSSIGCSILGTKGVVTTTCADSDEDGYLDKSSVISVCGEEEVCDFDSVTCVAEECSNTCDPGLSCFNGDVWLTTCVVADDGCLDFVGWSWVESCSNGCEGGFCL
jgi:hypothetical protein